MELPSTLGIAVFRGSAFGRWHPEPLVFRIVARDPPTRPAPVDAPHLLDHGLIVSLLVIEKNLHYYILELSRIVAPANRGRL